MDRIRETQVPLLKLRLCVVPIKFKQRRTLLGLCVCVCVCFFRQTVQALKNFLFFIAPCFFSLGENVCVWTRGN